MTQTYDLWDTVAVLYQLNYQLKPTESCLGCEFVM